MFSCWDMILSSYENVYYVQGPGNNLVLWLGGNLQSFDIL